MSFFGLAFLLYDFFFIVTLHLKPINQLASIKDVNLLASIK